MNSFSLVKNISGRLLKKGKLVNVDEIVEINKDDLHLEFCLALIRHFRDWLIQLECECDTDVHFCGRCAMLVRIDADMAVIGGSK